MVWPLSFWAEYWYNKNSSGTVPVWSTTVFLNDRRLILCLLFVQRQMYLFPTALRRKSGSSGKSEQWLMLAMEGDKKMYFAGSDEPLAMAEVSLYGSASGDCYNKLTGKITEILSDVLSIPANRIYVRYAETEYWGWNGENF